MKSRGYASATSINRGEPLRFYIHSTDPTVRVAIYRMGWYGGSGAGLMRGGITIPGVRQPMPTADPVTGLIECDWQGLLYTQHEHRRATGLAQRNLSPN